MDIVLHPDPLRDAEMKEELRQGRESFNRDLPLLARAAAHTVVDYALRNEVTRRESQHIPEAAA